jgi:prolipoprotein diacylglyceryltransferase
MMATATRFQAASGQISLGAPESLPVHPLQMYFAALALSCSALALLVRKRQARPGTAALACILVHETGKGLLEFLRPVQLGGRHLAVVSFAIALLAAVALLRRRSAAGGPA